MKKLTALILIVMLLAGGALSESAQSALQTDLTLGEDFWVSSSAFLADRMYLTSGGSFYVYTPGTQEPEKLKVVDARGMGKPEGQSEEAVYYQLRLFRDGDSLYAVDLSDSQMIYPLALEGKTLTIAPGVSINTEPLRNMEYGDEGYMDEPLSMLAQNGRLYVIARFWGNGGEDELKLFSFDIAKGGECKEHAAPNVWSLAPYREGKLLAAVMNPRDSYDQKAMANRNFRLCALNPADDSLTELWDSGVPFDYNSISLAYDAENALAYVEGKTEIYRVAEGQQAEICAYLPPSQFDQSLGGGLFPLKDGRILSIRGRDFTLRGTDPALLPKGRLTIYGSYMNDTHQKAIKAMNGIPVSFLDNTWFSSAQQLGQALVSGEDSFDIYMLNVNFMDLKNLMKKGYAQDLSASESLKKYVSSLYPMMQQAGSLDGKLYMVPVEMNVEGLFSYYSKLVEQVKGFELPKTYDEMIDAIQNWNDNLGEEYPDFTIMQQDDFKYMMVTMALDMQKNRMAMQGRDFSYNDPQLRHMLERALSLNTENIAQKIDWTSPDAQSQSEELYSRPPLLETYYWLDLERMNREMSKGEDEETLVGWGDGSKTYDVGQNKPLMLSAAEGEEPVTPITLWVMAVNPKSKNLDAAIAYVEQYVNNIEAAKKAMMNPDMNEDIENPRFLEETKWLDEYEAQMKKAWEEAEGAEKTQAEKDYQEAVRRNQKERERAKFSVRAETIAFYREIIKNSYVREYDPALTSQDMYQLQQRLIEGQMPLDQFLSESEGKLRLIRLEGQ